LTGRHETADMNTFSWVWVPYIACILDTVHCWTGTWVLAFYWITTFLHSNGIKGVHSICRVLQTVVLLSVLVVTLRGTEKVKPSSKIAEYFLWWSPVNVSWQWRNKI
jgi:uncharacterized membrane protein